MAAPVATVCATHPKRDRVATCGTCGKAVCRECVVHTGVGIKCRTCTGEKAPAAPRGARPRWLVPAAIGGAVVLVGAVLALRGGGGSTPVDDEVRSADAAGSQFPIERKVELTGGGNVRIGATLTLPSADKTPVAAALIIPGSGAIDRDAVMTITPDRSADRLSQDQNYSRPGAPDNLFKDVSNALVALDVATLRYDKRGSGASPLRDDQPLSYDDLVADAKAGVDFLSQRRETATAPLVLVGADQGGLIAMRLAAAAPRMKGVALLATSGRPLADVLYDDLARRGEQGQKEADQLREVATRLVAGQPLPAPDQLLQNLQAVLRPLQERYLRAVFSLDPVAEARAVKVPALLAWGGSDTSTTVVDVERLLAVLPAGSDELIFPDGDHNLGVNARRDANLVAQVARWLVARATA